MSIGKGSITAGIFYPEGGDERVQGDLIRCHTGDGDAGRGWRPVGGVLVIPSHMPPPLFDKGWIGRKEKLDCLPSLFP